MERIHTSLRALLGAALVSLVALAAHAPAAHAGLLVRSADNCAEQVYERPFLRWADPFTYVLAPDGTAEDGDGWRLEGASFVEGNEPFYVHAPGERQSIKLPPGSRATTGTMCVGIEHPTLRFFARNTGSPASLLVVSVRFQGLLGLLKSLPVGVVAAGSEWTPTLPLPVLVNLLPLLPGAKTPVQFSFAPLGAGEWQIDDVYVDPYRK